MRRELMWLVGSFFFFAASSGSNAIAATISITANAPDVLNGANLSCSIREAITNINNAATTYADCPPVGGYGAGDTIAIPAGTYITALSNAGGVPEDANLTGDYDILKSVIIQGAGATSTIIDGNGTTLIDRVFHAVAPAVTFTGVTIRNGLDKYATPGCLTCRRGGGIYIVGGAATIANSTISGNSAEWGQGSGIYLLGGSMTVTSSTISNNRGDGTGGGIYNNGGALTVVSATFTNNAMHSGGGIVNGVGGTLSVSSSTFQGNEGFGGAGGGIMNDGVASVTGSSFSGGRAFEGAGGIENWGTITIDSCSITNSFGWAGGFKNWAPGVATLVNSTISGNSQSPGAIVVGGSVTITNSTISGHSKTGVSLTGGSLAVTNVTFMGNGAVASAIDTHRALKVTGGTVTLSNTILAGQVTGTDCLITAPGAVVSLGYNIATDATCGLASPGDLAPNAAISASLGALAANGGPTQTHALLAGSPAIDKGTLVTLTDQRGVARPQPAGLLCDIGAFEAEQFPLTAAVVGLGVVTGGATINCGLACMEYVVNGGQVNLTATAGAGSTFVGWTGGPCSGTTTNPCPVTVTAAQTITANFSDNALVVTVVGSGAVNSAPAGINCPTAAQCSSAYPPATAVTLTATPTGAAVFTGWTVTSGACVGAVTPCAVTVTGIINLAAKFDLYGCTSPTATNYDSAATINNGTCVFPPPPSGGGGGGGGGLNNQAPYNPGGVDWLVSPTNEGYGDGNTPFVWKTLTDLDGDTILYYLYICPNGDFEGCHPKDVISGNGGAKRQAFGFGAMMAVMGLIGFGWARGWRRRPMMALAVIALAGSVAIIACGGSGADKTGVVVKTCSQAGAQTLCRENMALTPGAYQWKVLADDSRGGLIVSETRSFTVK